MVILIPSRLYRTITTMVATRVPIFLLLFAGMRMEAQTPENDPLGRSTPKGTVLGFLTTAHREDYPRATQYLDTPLHGQAATELASQLAVVLDQGLPANLDTLSDKPE